MKPITIAIASAVLLLGAALWHLLLTAYTKPRADPQAAVIAAYINRLDPGLKGIARCVELERTLGRALTEDEIRRVFAEVHGKGKE